MSPHHVQKTFAFLQNIPQHFFYAIGPLPFPMEKLYLRFSVSDLRVERGARHWRGSYPPSWISSCQQRDHGKSDGSLREITTLGFLDSRGRFLGCKAEV